MRRETATIIDKYYSKTEAKLFEKFGHIIEKNYKDVIAQTEIWKYDQLLGGLGGYATPLNITINPFNNWGNYRNVFRSLQYARSGMFLCDRPRHIIQDAGLHIETIVKLILSNRRILGFMRNRSELGKNIDKLYKNNLIEKELYDRLYYWKKLYNCAKHDTDPNKARTFDGKDAILFYFESRIIGNKLLKKLSHHTCGHIYDIDRNFEY